MIQLIVILFGLNIAIANDIRVVPIDLKIIAICKINYGKKGTYPTVTRVYRYNNKYLWGTADGHFLKEDAINLTYKKIPLYKCRVVGSIREGETNE